MPTHHHAKGTEPESEEQVQAIVSSLHQALGQYAESRRMSALSALDYMTWMREQALSLPTDSSQNEPVNTDA